jgi:hypothetical protein
MVVSHGLRVRFRTVSVGNTAIQIIRASWCLLGGTTWVEGATGSVFLLGGEGAWDMLVLLL